MLLKATLVLALALTLCHAAAADSPVRVPKPEEALAGLVKEHPRLVLAEQRLAELKRLAGTDKLLARAVEDVIREADSLARREKLVYKVIGPRLLNVSRDCVRRMYAFGLAWRWTGQKRYLEKARENLLAVCDFPDWNPSHFLDTAEMSHGVAIGYDWFYAALDEPTRQRVREGLIKHGLKVGVEAYRTGKHGWWSRSEFNWNQVCNSGLLIGSLGIAETDPEYARQIIPAAVASLPKALATYAPDGAWPEGPGYWGYATRYTVYGLAAMQTALGTDFGLSKLPGLDQAGWFPLHTAGPTGRYFNYADTGGTSRRGNVPSLFWLARRYDQPYFAAAEREEMGGGRVSPLDVIWYVSAPASKPPDPPTAKLFGGKVPVAVFRSAWGDPNALFAGIKAGYNQVNHGHLDLGSFEMDALGVRWARELGSDNYNLPGYWGMGTDSQRWTYYRLGSLSHNIPLLDDQHQDVRAVAKVAAFVGDGRNGFVVIDLGTAYKHAATKATRGLRVLDGRTVLVQDELEISKACRAAWGMTTDARIDARGTEARLTLDGKALTARVLSPAGASFTVESAERKSPEATNRGVRRLMVRLPAEPGLLRFAVLLSPDGSAGPRVESHTVLPLADWKQPADKRP